MIGDPAEKTNLSMSVDWKIMRKQRKMKIRDLKNEIKKKETQNSDERAKLLNDHKIVSGEGPQDLKKTIVVGVLPVDVSKNGEFNTHSYSGEDSAGQIGPDGKRISYSYDGNNDTTLLYDYQRR